jgi:hypothetical protein
MAIGKTFEIVLDVDNNEVVLHDLRITKFTHGDDDSFANESVLRRDDQLLGTLYVAKVSYTQDKVLGSTTTLSDLIDIAKGVTQRAYGDNVFPQPVVTQPVVEMVNDEKVEAVEEVAKVLTKVSKTKKD